MPLPTDDRTINNLVASTREHIRPFLVDNVFTSNPLLARLYNKGKVLLDGGEEIRISFIYDKADGDWYVGLGSYVVQTKETVTQLRFDWKQIYAPITLPGIDVFKNQGPHRSFDLVASQFTVASMTMADRIGTALYNDGTNSTHLTGLRLATSNTGTYGGIARGAGAVADAIEGNVDTTGGAITVPFINSLMGTASRSGARKPDLLLTTQIIWDAVWARVQPQQRFPAGEGNSWDVGVDYININGSALVPDGHCPTGFLFGLPTDFIEFYVGEGKDFYVRGPFELHNQDGFTAQVVLYCELALQAPNLSFQASGLTA